MVLTTEWNHGSLLELCLLEYSEHDDLSKWMSSASGISSSWAPHLNLIINMPLSVTILGQWVLPGLCYLLAFRWDSKIPRGKFSSALHVAHRDGGSLFIVCLFTKNLTRSFSEKPKWKAHNIVAAGNAIPECSCRVCLKKMKLTASSEPEIVVVIVASGNNDQGATVSMMQEPASLRRKHYLSRKGRKKKGSWQGRLLTLEPDFKWYGIICSSGGHYKQKQNGL